LECDISFDPFDRPSGLAYASGKTGTYSYNGKNITTTENGISSTYYYDAQGNLTSVSDPAGTITYNLRPDGQPSSIEAPGNVTTSFGYDGYGRQTNHQLDQKSVRAALKGDPRKEGISDLKVMDHIQRNTGRSIEQAHGGVDAIYNNKTIRKGYSKTIFRSNGSCSRPIHSAIY